MESSFIQLERALTQAALHVEKAGQEMHRDPDQAISLWKEILPTLQTKSFEIEQLDLHRAKVKLPSETSEKLLAATQKILHVSAMGEKSGSVAVAALMGSESVRSALGQLRDLSEFLKRGERVERVEPSNLKRSD